MGEGESNKQSFEGVAGRIAEQRDNGIERNTKSTKWGKHLQYLLACKQGSAYKVPLWRSSQSSSRKSTSWGASLKCHYTKAGSRGNKHELQICVQLQGYDLAGMAFMTGMLQWDHRDMLDGSHDWSCNEACWGGDLSCFPEHWVKAQMEYSVQFWAQQSHWHTGVSPANGH